jgi:hypothetical protein
MSMKKLIASHAKRKINLEQLAAFCRLKPTMEDCCAFFNVSDETIRRLLKETVQEDFVTFRDRHVVESKHDLIRKAIEMALEGNTTMLVFCLKNLCGWFDRAVNLGINAEKETETHIAPQQIEDGNPVFSIEVGKDGRFTRPRPRLLTINGDIIEDDKKD